MIKVVVLILTVWNTSNGDKLFEHKKTFDVFSISGDLINDCRIYGVREAHRLSDEYGKTNKTVSTNVDCHWELKAGAPA